MVAAAGKLSFKPSQPTIKYSRTMLDESIVSHFNNDITRLFVLYCFQVWTVRHERNCRSPQRPVMGRIGR